MSGFSKRLSSLAAVEIPAAPPPTTTILPFAEEVAALAVPAPAAVANPAAAIIFTKWRLSIFPIDFNVSFISSWVSIVIGFLSGFSQFVSENQSGYETERFENYKKLYNDRLSSVKVAAVVRGEENAVLLSLITDAVNQMGLSVVGPEDSSALLSVEADAQVDGYGSERLKGLVWASTSAAISLRDLQAGTTFARFNVYDRAGTGRKADSLRKSMEGVGNKASAEIVKRLTEYLKTK